MLGYLATKQLEEMRLKSHPDAATEAFGDV